MRQVTIGLCVKNAEKTIQDTLDSIMNQDFSHENMEMVVVDGCSKDRTMDIVVNAISKTDIRAKVYCDEGKGLSTARQMVVDNARGEYIVWVDGDVVLSKDFVRRQLDFISKNPDVGLVIGQYEHIELKGELVSNIVSLYMSLLRIVHFGATTSKTAAIKEVNGFDKRIKGASEDMDIARRMVLAHWKLAINSKAKFFHKQKGTIRDLVNRGVWYGYGGHFMGHKYEALIKIPYRLPLIYFAWGLKLSFEAYRKYRKKKSFLIPIACSFFSIGWCLGFILGHIHQYGHSIKDHEIKKERTLIAVKEVQKMLTAGGH